MPLRPDLPPLPHNMRHLSIDEERGYPVPWFVHWHNGKPEFRVTGEGRREIAWGLRVCWVCGNQMNQPPQPHRQTFVIGPMCSINRVSAEPGCHFECAVYSAIACPFLTKPNMVRREGGLAEQGECPAGEMIMRNPGVTCLWTSDSAEQFDDGTGGWLIDVGDPVQPPLWYSQGRLATPAEISESIRTGLPILEEMARQQGRGAIHELNIMAKKALGFMPAGVVLQEIQ